MPQIIYKVHKQEGFNFQRPAAGFKRTSDHPSWTVMLDGSGSSGAIVTLSVD